MTAKSHDPILYTWPFLWGCSGTFVTFKLRRYDHMYHSSSKKGNSSMFSLAILIDKTMTCIPMYSSWAPGSSCYIWRSRLDWEAYKLLHIWELEINSETGLDKHYGTRSAQSAQISLVNRIHCYLGTYTPTLFWIHSLLKNVQCSLKKCSVLLFNQNHQKICEAPPATPLLNFTQ